MTHNVFANLWQVASKSGNNKSIARFPDVCLSPPSPPAGPIPIPYPDTAFSTDLKKGSKSVKVGGKPVALAQQSHYQASVLGNEAATNSFGANVITHKITGKTVFQAWSMDVKFEGKNVCRHVDITTSNHNCPPPATPPLPTVEMATSAALVEDNKCPCCGAETHPWQKDETGKKFEPIPEKEFWQKRVDGMKKGKEKGQKILDMMLEAKKEQREARARGEPACPNVSEADGERCGTYLDVPPGAKSSYPSSAGGTSTKTVAQVQKRYFDTAAKQKVVNAWESAQTDEGNKEKVRKQSKLNHSTPGMAGGCNSANNVVPNTLMAGKKCSDIEAWQSGLEKI